MFRYCQHSFVLELESSGLGTFLDFLLVCATCHILVVMEKPLLVYPRGRHQICQLGFCLLALSVFLALSLAALGVTLSCSFFSFIENFGTHIITSVTIGGKDEVYIKQHHSSQLSASDIKKYVEDIGDQRFLSLGSQSDAAPYNYKDKVGAFCYFRCIDHNVLRKKYFCHTILICSHAWIADPFLLTTVTLTPAYEVLHI